MLSRLNKPNGEDGENVTAGAAAPRNPLAARLRTALPWLALVLAVAVGSVWIIGRLRPPELHGTVLQASDLPADLTLEGSDGQQHSLRDFAGKWTAIYFGYTYCPDVCPTTLADLRLARQELGARADDLQVVMVTVDPKRDSAEKMATYLKAFDPTFLGLTGSEEQINAAATQFGIYYEEQKTEGATGYLMNHTSTVILLDPVGRMRFLIPYGVKGTDIAADLRYFMRRG